MRDTLGRFIKGNIPWTTGQKGIHLSLQTEFKKGHKHSEKIKEKIKIHHIGKKLSQEHKIKISESNKNKKIGKNNPMFNLRGKEHPCWKGGITSLTTLIRESTENIKWRNEIFKRDNYICQECYRNKIFLHAHHIKSFNKILKEFLNQYSQFSPFEDKEILLRLAITYEPFWDINNGKTLCKKCHLAIIGDWVRRH